MNAFLALYVSNAKEFVRDRLAMFFTLLLPIAFALLFGSIFSNSQAFQLRLGLIVEDAGPAGEQFAVALQLPETRQIIDLQRGSRDELMAALGKGNLDVVLALPDNLSRSIGAKQQVPLQVYYDPTRQASAGTGLGIVRTVLAQANLAIAQAPALLVPDERSVQTRPVRAADFFVPGLLGMAMLWLGLFATAQPVAEQREQQVLRRFGATPLSKTTLLAGQVSWRVTLGLVQAALFVILGKFVMGVNLSGDWLLFIAAVLLGALVFVTMGYFVAALSRTVESAVAIAQVINFPMMFLSGTFFEASVMPSFLKPIAQVLPLTYLNDALRQTMVSFTPMYALWLDFAILGAWLVLLLGLSIKFFRWE